jgi:acyl carrier protein
MRRDFVIGEDDSLLERGVIDSIGVMELIEFIETQFGVAIEDQDITEQNMGSLRAIGAFVSSRATAAMVA